MQNVSIKAAVPHIFRRPLLYVGPHDAIVHAATFLAIGPQIYADGLVVLDAERLVGRIGGWNIASRILEYRERWLVGHAEEIMEPLGKPLDDDSLLDDAIRIFTDTRFGFMPVASGGKVVASLSIRDLLGIIDGTRKVAQLASSLTTIHESTSVGEALRFMYERGVRNLVALRQDGPYVLNDRNVLEFLLSHEARQLVIEKGFSALDHISLSHIGLHKGITIGPEESASVAAKMLSDVNTPCLFIGDRILTPWDLVIK